jgi:hypothetical protein
MAIGVALLPGHVRRILLAETRGRRYSSDSLLFLQQGVLSRQNVLEAFVIFAG